MFLHGVQTNRVSVLIGTHQPIGTAQTRRVREPIGSQIIWTAQVKRFRLWHGSHALDGNEVIFIYLHQGIHGDEHNVCL